MDLKSGLLAPLSPEMLCAETCNIFKTARMVGERAKQILVRNKRSFEEAIEAVSVAGELSRAQRESLALEYEKRLKPVLEAIEDLVAGDLVPVQPAKTRHHALLG